ncbi:MDR family MFS transporter [Lihuaxuella thermophila]|uniref:Drug resistance transporter, EmrB/QacA subfamily n=1 Tax=Lihuaxuella thermophila TaxID=1173111 RepID=A0A1H8C2W2_9BACL|nr:MDR family MFS transporter [Lihuaxuella thermophila]SEM89189.1 drug resistance transporter, EmrB/QacA subfamily [Lihuaxuella thermophila]
MNTDQAVLQLEEQQQAKENRGILIAGLIIAMLFAALDNTIVGTALPRIVGELGGLSLMAWLTTAYMLSSTTIVPIAGKLADLLGRKNVYVAGLGIFIIGSALCGMAQTMHELVWFRALQGVGGGIMMPMAMIVIGDLFSGKDRAKWQGIFGAVFGLSSVIGPQVGGWIVDSLNWRWVFYINLPVGILATILIAIGLKGHRAAGPVKIDFGGMITMSAGIVSLLLALTFGGKDYEWGSWQILSLFAVSVVSFILFAVIETRTSEPILPLQLFRNKIFTLINGIGFLMSVGMFGSIMFVPLFMQGVVGVSATESGTIMTPMMITMIIASIVGGRLLYKIGVRVQILAGMFLMAVGFGLLSTMGVDTSSWVATSYMMVLGLGMGLVMPTLTIILQETFPKSQLGVVTSSSQFFRQIGGTFGMTVLGAIMNHQSSQLLTEKLEPVLQKAPPQASGMIDSLTSMIHKDAQGLYSSLLNPEAMQKMPDMLKQTIVPILKVSLVDSLQIVFLSGLIFVILGAVLAPFLGKLKLNNPGENTPEETTNPSL